ncbi:amine dehydrogenase large subunit [Zoogloea sp.]|uniref:amine dehydrogenase large subunit n=1 Tax=Zoogloea sp. TaxID=49181 RepID=UPI002600ACA6|nr:amine dehydrogenase large subunit [Zoogloea sp.]MCK6395122.1 amine dehydrogenase [Zoogloea sp.]
MLRKAFAGSLLSTALALGASAGAMAELPTESITTGKLPPPNPYRIYLHDVAIGHIVDGRLHVIDGEKLRYEGVIATGLAGQAALSADRKEIFVATTYYSRLSHGVRTDVVDVHDAQTLALTGEIEIPPRHAQSLHYKGTIRPSADGRWLFVQYATPATSVGIIDLKTRKAVNEVATPGCWAILPAASVGGRFSTVCGDGTLLTVSLDDAGQVRTQKRSARFFDPDKDPIFIHSEQDGDTYRFVSFHGEIHTAHVGGEVASYDAPWSVLGAADRKQGWRPGGYQVFAQHNASGRLYVGMHDKGKEGSHKTPAKEIWTVDLASKKRIARTPGNDAIALAVSQGERPRLFAYDGVKAAIAVFDASRKLTLSKRMEGVGETPTQMELH